jgi:aryl-alcohol dehydrogenase-like predicted oxidoreductase
MQNHLNLLYREEEREMLPLCRDQGVGVIPWSPLARGRLTRTSDTKTARSESDKFGRFLYRAMDEADRSVIDRVGEVAAARDLPRAQVALAWLLAKPGVTAPIVGATKPEHLADAAAAVDVTLSADEIASLEDPYVPHPVAGFE